MMLYKSRTLLIAVFILFLSSALFGQQGNTFYFMDRASQSTYFNPAYDNPYKITVGGLMVPVIGQIPPTMYMNYANNGFTYKNLIHHGEGAQADSLIFDFDNFLNKKRNVNHLRFQNHFDLLHVGIKTENAFLHFNITEKINYGVSIPGDLFDLAYYGNNYFKEDDESVDLSGLNISMCHYREFAGGFNTEIMDGLRVGGNVKFLFGKANVDTKIDELSLYTAQDNSAITANANMEMRSSLPIPLTYQYFDESDSLVIEMDSTAEDFDPGSYLTNMKNFGIGVDLGAVYQINEDWTAYFSVNDLGFLTWNSNQFNLKTDGIFNFRGIEVDYFDDEDNTLDDAMEELGDSVINIFHPEHNNNSYITWLPTDMYLGGQYHVLEQLDVGGLYRMEFYNGSVLHSMTVSANSDLTHWFTGHLSYSVANNSMSNLGLGFTIRGAFLQYYLVTDNILAMFPQSTRNLNIRMGCNLVFGYKKSVESKSFLGM